MRVRWRSPRFKAIKKERRCARIVQLARQPQVAVQDWTAPVVEAPVATVPMQMAAAKE
eukprot:SAG11_NODE_33075_length_279_cov_0.827778_1_plen_57_part_10